MTTHDDAIARNYRAGYYNACDGKGWQKCAEGLSVEASEARDGKAHFEERSRAILSMPSVGIFRVGQTISTLAEYEALPVGATVWPDDCSHETDPSFFWTKADETDNYLGRRGFSMHLAGYGRVIRSLP